MSDKNLIQIQSAKQTAFATPVTPMTVKFMEITDITVKPILEVKRLPDMRGSLAPAYIAALQKQAVTAQIKGVATHEDICYWLESIFGVATPSGTGPYTRAANAPLTAVVASPRMFTLTVGEAVDGPYQLDGMLASKLAFTVKNADKLDFTVDLIGLKVDGAGTLAALSDRTVTPIMASDITPYIDAVGGTIGSTAFAANIYSLDWTIDTKRDLRYYLGAVTPGRYREPNTWELTMKAVMEFIAASPNSAALLTALMAITPGSTFAKQLRLKAANGTNVLQLDGAGVNETAPDLWTYDNNVQTMDLTLMGLYNTALANYAAYSSTNSVATLP
ncbi:MAG: phage tail tube protein [Anaerolineae bacterium]